MQCGAAAGVYQEQDIHLLPSAGEAPAPAPAIAGNASSPRRVTPASMNTALCCAIVPTHGAFAAATPWHDSRSLLCSSPLPPKTNKRNNPELGRRGLSARSALWRWPPLFRQEYDAVCAGLLLQLDVFVRCAKTSFPPSCYSITAVVGVCALLREGNRAFPILPSVVARHSRVRTSGSAHLWASTLQAEMLFLL